MFLFLLSHSRTLFALLSNKIVSLTYSITVHLTAADFAKKYDFRIHSCTASTDNDHTLVVDDRGFFRNSSISKCSISL